MKSFLKAAAVTEELSLITWEPIDLPDYGEMENHNYEDQVRDLFQLTGKDKAISDGLESGIASNPDDVDQTVIWQPDDLANLPALDTEIKNVKNFSCTGEEILKEIVPPDKYQEKIDEAKRIADEIIAQAERNAAEIILQTQKNAELEMAEAYRQGWERAKAETQSILQGAGAITEEVYQWRDNILAASEKEVLTMVKDIAVAVFGSGVELDDAGLQANFNRVLENTKTLGEIKILVNSQDAAVLDPSWCEIQSTTYGNKIQIVPCEEITRGGCYIQGTYGTVDARVETGLSSVFEKLDEEVNTTENEQ